MNIIYCCPAQKETCEKVKRIFEIVVATKKYDIFYNIPDLEKYLRSCLSHDHLIILHASDQEHLHQFVLLQELLVEHRIILILPDREPGTIALGHSLRPRFITYNDSDFLEMASVICNILRPVDNNTLSPAERFASSGKERYRL